MTDWTAEIARAATMPPGTRVRVAYRDGARSPQPSRYAVADGSEGKVANLERHRRTGLLFVELDDGRTAIFNPLDLRRQPEET